MIDLTAALEAGLRSRPERGDEQYPHMSAISCDLQAYASRSGETFAPRSPETLLKMAMGLQVEREVLDAIVPRFGPGTTIYRDLAIAYDPFMRRTRYFEGGCLDDETIGANELIGHPDLVVGGEAVIEVKSTVFYGKPPTAAADYYVEQAAIYATALDAPRFAVFVVCRASGRVAEFWFETADYCDWSIMRAKEILQNTNPENFPPDAAPRQGWSCKTCGWHKCALNPSHKEELVNA